MCVCVWHGKYVHAVCTAEDGAHEGGEGHQVTRKLLPHESGWF